MTTKQINSLVSKYKKTRFSKGKSFNLDFLVKHAHITPLGASFTREEATKFNSQVVAAYTQINKVLALRGLYCKSSNYYSKFTIIQNTAAKVKDYRKKATVNLKAAVTLAQGDYAYAGQWKSLTKAEQARVDTHIHRTSFQLTRY